MSRWQYKDGRGVEVEGEYLGFVEGQGSDITYSFRQDDGTVDLVSGVQLKGAKIMHGWSRQVKLGTEDD